MAALEEIDIVELARQHPSSLSSGEQQRAAIARALVGSRHLLIADEPTGALDALAAEEVMRLVRRRCDEGGVAALLATHDPAVAGWADRVVYLRDGVLSDHVARAFP
jgi:putative ABC transport system ATP-binding protein